MTSANDPGRVEAESLLQAYREGLKQWTLVAFGADSGNEAELRAILDRLNPQLLAIADKFPDTTYTVDILVNARKRAGVLEADRPGSQPTGSARAAHASPKIPSP